MNSKNTYAFDDVSLPSNISTTCSYCGVGCGVSVSRNVDGGLSIQGDENHQVNAGKLCSKGRTLHYTVMDQTDRLLYPEMRLSKSAPLERVSWDQAMQRAVAVFASVIEKYGPDAVAFYVSGQLLTEEYYLANKLAKGIIGTANIDTNSRLCMSSAVVAYKKSLGADTVPISYEDIEHCECFLIAGANPAWCHPILFRRIEARKAAHPEVKIIVVDPRRTESCELADLHLQIDPGSDVILYNAIAKVLIEDNLIDANFISKHVNDFEQLKTFCKNMDLEDAAKNCGVTIDEIKQAAQWIGHAESFLTMWAVGLNQSSIGVDKNLALINLNLITGTIGKLGSGPFSLTGQPNAMGGREVGGLSNMLAAHRSLENEQHRKEVAEHWQVPVSRIPSKAGLNAVQLFDAIDAGKIKAVWVICTNPAVSMPNSNKIEQALKKVPFLIVQDISNKSDTLEYADLKLPAAGWLEKEGTMTNSERRITHLAKFVDAPGEALPDGTILQDFSSRLNNRLHGKALAIKSSADVFAEHALLTKGTNLDVSGLSHSRLQNESSMQWPVPDEAHLGSARLFEDHQFFTKNKKANIFTCNGRNTSEALSKEFPLVLNTGRYRDQWHTMTRTGKVNLLGRHKTEPRLEISHADAKLYNIKDNQLLEIKSRRGKIALRAQLTIDIRQGNVFAPMHWGKLLNSNLARTNNITNPLCDPVSGEPDFKYSAVHVSVAKKSKERIVIIGAGAAAFAFLDAYRKDNISDSIEILSSEKEAFYNRILLPEYISAQKNWSDLKYETLADLDPELNKIFTDTRVSSIDTQNCLIHDQKGNKYQYDKLIIATGSEPRKLNSLVEKIEQKRTHTLRNQNDALRLKNEAGELVIINGGGLLGVELAAALSETGRQVHLVHRSAHLMSRQLDKSAARILEQHLKSKGIKLYLNDEVLGCYPTDTKLNTAFLASGKRLAFTDLAFALGTQPRTKLAQEAGLKVNYGIQVDSQLRTSDEKIFAIGECAELNRKTWGTTLAAQQMGATLARIFIGEAGARYSGSPDLNVLKVEGLQLASFGVSQVGSKEDQTLLMSDLSKGYYKKIIISNDLIKGAILVGDTSDFARLREMHVHALELGDQRDSLLGSTTPVVELKGAVVCSCNNVGEGNIADAVQAGAVSYDLIEAQTGAGSGCGSCRPAIQRIIKHCLSGSSEVVDKSVLREKSCV